MVITAKIPIKKYLKKYITGKYHLEYPLRIDKTFQLGLLIIKSFSENKNKPKCVDYFSETLEVEFDHQHDLTLSAGNVFDFNSLLEDIYRQELAMFIGHDRFFNRHPERKQAIIIFNSNFGITEEDIATETLIKHIQRHEEDTQIFITQRFKKVS